eukprot:GEMP01002214.1.p1 GENE.GEMP01002214.1~~GEMP01002214.1.p1  ORF type:complete len:979 (+),score=165.16 GEMP01002214.1:210-3146(+)
MPSPSGRKSRTPHLYAFGDVWKNTSPTSAQTDTQTSSTKDASSLAPSATQDNRARSPQPSSEEEPPRSRDPAGSHSGRALRRDQSPATDKRTSTDTGCRRQKSVHFTEISSFQPCTRQGSKGHHYKGKKGDRRNYKGRHWKGRHWSDHRGSTDSQADHHSAGGKGSQQDWSSSSPSTSQRGSYDNRGAKGGAPLRPTPPLRSATLQSESHPSLESPIANRDGRFHHATTTPTLVITTAERLQDRPVPVASSRSPLQTINSSAALEGQEDEPSPSDRVRVVEHLDPNGLWDRRSRQRDVASPLSGAGSSHSSMVAPMPRGEGMHGSWQECFEDPELLPRGSQLVSPTESAIEAGHDEDSLSQNTSLDGHAGFRAPRELARLTILRVSSNDPHASMAEKVWGTKIIATLTQEEEIARKDNYGLSVPKNSKLEKAIKDMQLRLGQIVVRPGDFEKTCQEMAPINGELYPRYQVRYRAEWFSRRPGLLGAVWYGHEVEQELDQLRFYDRLLFLAERDPYWRLHATGCVKKFGGLVRLDCDMRYSGKREAKNLILLQNLTSGYIRFRTLTLKIGAETSITGHRGVSRLQRWKDKQISEATNSHLEGYRAELVAHPSEALHDLIENASQMDRRTMKFGILRLETTRLQEMGLGHLLQYIFDFKQGGTELWKFSERYVHDSLISWLRGMYNFCNSLERLSPPQKWVDTHLTFGFDATSSEHRWKKCTIRSHNWQSSEITMENEFQNMTRKDREEHTKFWNEYCTSMYRIGWEIARYTVNRALSTKWRGCVFEIECLKNREVYFCSCLRSLNNKRQILELWWRNGKNNAKKRVSMTVAVQEIDDDYSVTVADIVNLPSDIFPGSKFIIHCVAFAKEQDIEGYYTLAKGERMTMTMDGRAFSQPSRVHTLGPKVKDIAVQESFYFSRSCVDPTQLDFGDYKLFDQDFPPNLRFLPNPTLESSGAHFVKRFSAMSKKPDLGVNPTETE